MQSAGKCLQHLFFRDKSQFHQYLSYSFVSMFFLVCQGLSDLFCGYITFLFQDLSDSKICFQFLISSLGFLLSGIAFLLFSGFIFQAVRMYRLPSCIHSYSVTPAVSCHLHMCSLPCESFAPVPPDNFWQCHLTWHGSAAPNPEV